MHGRYHVSVKDIQALAKPILRHRIMTNFYAESERINSDTIVERLLETVPRAQERDVSDAAQPRANASSSIRRSSRASARSS